MSGWKPQVCTCGHTTADHARGGAHGLHKVSYGFCWVNGCQCKKFEDAEPKDEK